MSQTYVFQPDKYLTSTVRALKEYLETGLNLGNADDPYEIRMEYPDVLEMSKAKVPLAKTLIHFDIDDNAQRIIGLGENVFNADIEEVPGSDPIEETIVDWEGRCHELSFDVGVWASVETGGPTARMEAREDLDTLLNGTAAYRACHAATEGVEILSFTGGRNLIDSINDVTIFRTVDLMLRVRVYARFKRFPVPAIEEFAQVPEIIIDDELIVN